MLVAPISNMLVAPPTPPAAWPRTSMATLVVLAALHIGAYRVAAVRTFQPPAVGAVLLGCSDLEQPHTSHGPAMAVCFDPQFVNPHAGLLRDSAESANAARAVAWRKMFRGSYLHRPVYVHEQWSSTDCARARFDPTSGPPPRYKPTSPSTLRQPHLDPPRSSPSLPPLRGAVAHAAQLTMRQSNAPGLLWPLATPAALPARQQGRRLPPAWPAKCALS